MLKASKNDNNSKLFTKRCFVLSLLLFCLGFSYINMTIQLFGSHYIVKYEDRKKKH